MMTENTKKRIVARAVQGRHPIEIAREFAVHDTTVRKLLRAEGVAYAPRGRTG